MGRDYCVHMVRMDDTCWDCVKESPAHIWDCARAWASLAMWCMCLEDHGSVECWRCGKTMPMQVAVAGEGDLWECHKCYRDLNAREEAQRDSRAWQAFRDWLNGTPLQWRAHVYGVRIKDAIAGLENDDDHA